jgi:hypothetical protein
MGKEFVLEEAEVELTPSDKPADTPAADEKPHGEDETPEESPEGTPPGEKPAAEKPKPSEPPIPKEAEPHLARMRRAHEREITIARLQERNKVLEELVTKGVRLPAADKPDGNKPAAEDGFVFNKPRPTRDTFEGSETEYEDALLDWREERSTKRREFETAQGQQTEAQKRSDELYDKMHGEALTRYPDYDEKIAESKDKGIQVSAKVADAVARFGGRYMADMIYHFATHPEEVTKLNGLTDPTATAEAVEDLRDTIAAQQKSRPRTRVPNPPPKLEDAGAGGGAGENEFDPNITAERRAEIGAARRAREAASRKK